MESSDVNCQLQSGQLQVSRTLITSAFSTVSDLKQWQFSDRNLVTSQCSVSGYCGEQKGIVDY